MYAYPYGMNNNMQQQLAQNRMEQLQQQYNNMFPMMQQQQQIQQPQQFLKGRPVKKQKSISYKCCYRCWRIHSFRM